MAYHLNPTTHKPGKCFAKTPDKCKFNKHNEKSTEHYSTKEEAQKASEEILEKQFKKNLFKKAFEVKEINRETQINTIKESLLRLGFKDRHNQLEIMLNNKETYKPINARGIEFSDRPNGIKYIFFPNLETKTIEKVMILENGGAEQTEEELKNIENELNEKIQQK